MIIGREELSLAASWATLFLEYPRLGTVLVVQMLALKLNNLLFVLDSNLANGTVLRIFLIMVNSFSLAPIDFVKGHVVFFFDHLFEHSGVALKPLFCCFLAHYVQGG